MSLSSLIRRSVAVTTATALLTGGLALAATPAQAVVPAAEITSVTPTSWDNRSTATVTVKGANLMPNDRIVLEPACSTDPTKNPVLPTSPGTPCAPLEGPEVTRITTTASSFSPPTNTAPAAISASVALGQAAPGLYRVIVKHPEPDGTESAAFGTLFKVFAYGGANATSSVPGVAEEGTDLVFGFDCGVTNDGCGRLPDWALDIKGGNISVGATVRFLLPNGAEDTGLAFVHGNPGNADNKFGGTSNADDGAAEGTAFPSAALLQGSYRYYDAAVTGHAKFTPGVHTLQVLNTDGQTTGSQSTFVQPWFLDSTSVTPSALGRGASVTMTINGAGFSPGAVVALECGSAGSAAPSNRAADGSYNTLTVPVTIKSNATLGSCGLKVTNPDGGVYSKPVLTIAGAPSITAISPDDTSYAHLGQGAHVGFEPGTGGGVVVTGTGFVDLNPVSAATKDPAKMTRFDFGPGITVTTRAVGAGSAFVSIDVAPDAAVGRRDVRAINPDGGSTTTGQPMVCDPVLGECTPEPDSDDLPLMINAGPKITAVSPTGFQQSQDAVAVEVTGTGFQTSIADAQVSITPEGIGHSKTVATATKVTFEADPLPSAAPGPRDLVITNPDDYGRATCAGCLSIDSLGVSPSTAPNTGVTGLIDLTVLAGGMPSLVGASPSQVTLTNPTLAAGESPIPAKTLTASSATAAKATFDLTNAALGRYNLKVVLDPASPSTSTVSCSLCFTVTGTPFTLDATTPVSPAKAGQGVRDWKLTFKGAHFTKGMQVSIPDVTVHDLTLVDSGTFTVLVDVASTATTGAKTGTVTGGDGSTKTFSFEVMPAPVAKAVTSGAAFGAGAGSPGSPTPGPSITVSGTGFAEDPDSKVGLGAGVTVTEEAVTPGDDPVGVCPLCLPGTDDAVTGKLVVDPTATPGKRAVTLTNPGDGGTSTLADAFTVNPGPQITAVANHNGQPALVRDGVKHQLAIYGSAFPTPADADKAAAFKITNADGQPADGITVENVQFTAAKITADVTVATGRALGPVRVAVYNQADQGFVQCTTCLAVAVPPTVPTSLKLVAGPRSLKATWVKPAGNFGSEVSGYRLELKRSGTTTTTVVSTTATQYTFNDLVNDATYTVTVQAVNGAGLSPKATATGIPGLLVTLVAKQSVRTVVYGSRVVYSGTLTKAGTTTGIGGKSIRLTFLPQVAGARAFEQVVGPTTSTGTWAFSYTPRVPTDTLKKVSQFTVKVNAAFLGDTTYRKAGAGTLVTYVAPQVRISSPLNGSRSSASTTIKVTGGIAPSKAGRTVYLYRFTSTGRTLIARTTVSSTSRFAFSIRPARGTYVLRAYIPATPGNVAAYSQAIKIYRV